ncbi:hypothetical protein WJX81_004021 [Elliptochloris bilobata]|uniref:F-box domain-containing protein n=1 Tax=Elliptochloris bilobata TaxID=381761 RepID=A0AAW1QHB8_9CHLO
MRTRAKHVRCPLKSVASSLFNDLPDELLLQIFTELAKVGPLYRAEEGSEHAQDMPFYSAEPHPGLRAYPFLSQVCRRWKTVLDNPAARDVLWRELVVDFGHELITAVHMPIAWSDRRPSDDEFRESFAATRLNAARILRFVEERQKCVQRLVLMNSEGYYSDGGDFVSLTAKHNFSMAHLGMVLGMLRHSLEELQVQHCNDFFAVGSGTLSAVACLPRLRVLRIEDLHCRADRDSLAELAQLRGLEELSISGEENASAWGVGMDCIPSQWSALTSLRTLQLRGHTMLSALPSFLTALPLTHLDVSACRAADLSVVADMTSLVTLSLQSMDLSESLASGAPAPQPHAALVRRLLPPLERLTSLTALNLANNLFTRVPAALGRLSALEFLDISGNPELQVLAPLAVLLGLPALRVVDLRGLHEEPALGYWSEAKCTSMRYVSAFTKALRRRPYPTRVLCCST